MKQRTGGSRRLLHIFHNHFNITVRVRIKFALRLTAAAAHEILFDHPLPLQNFDAVLLSIGFFADMLSGQIGCTLSVLGESLCHGFYWVDAGLRRGWYRRLKLDEWSPHIATR
jgi:hypothetical protein